MEATLWVDGLARGLWHAALGTFADMDLVSRRGLRDSPHWARVVQALVAARLPRMSTRRSLSASDLVWRHRCAVTSSWGADPGHRRGSVGRDPLIDGRRFANSALTVVARE